MRPATRNFLDDIALTLDGIRGEQLYKKERVITSQQYSAIRVAEASFGGSSES